MISVCIISRNEPFIWFVINALLKGVESDGFEILIYDDYSDEPLQVNSLLYPNVRVIHGSSQHGVGYGFDRMAEEAKYETLVLMAGDVIVKDPSWIDKVNDYVSMFPKSIGCSVCLSGDPYHLNTDYPADDTKRYGASIIPFGTTEDLPSDSVLTDRDQFYVGTMDAKWFKKAPDKNISEIPTVYGAFYFTNKSWIKTIHGWDTVRGMKLSGLSMWGGVDVFPSLKTWLYGGSCHVVCDIETLHVFHKSDDPLNGRTDCMWYSKLFVLYTCMELEEADRLAKLIYSLRVKYELYTRPFNLGKKLLKSNWDYVMQIRERNKREFIHDFDWFCDKFNIEKKW